MEACRVGWRKPLGHDMQRRRYWALGGSTGCWRVYVEEQEGALWGWYEGDLCKCCKHPRDSWRTLVHKEFSALKVGLKWYQLAQRRQAWRQLSATVRT